MYQAVDQNRKKQPIYELRNQTKRDINQPIQKQERIQSINKSIRTLFLPLYSLEPSISIGQGKILTNHKSRY